MKKRFLTKCVTTMLVTSLLMASLNVPVYAEGPQVIGVNEENVVESDAVGEESSDSLYPEESKETAVEPTESEESNSLSEETVVEESKEPSDPVESSETTASYEVLESESTEETDSISETIEETEELLETVAETTAEAELVTASELSLNTATKYAGQVVLSGNCGRPNDSRFDYYLSSSSDIWSMTGDEFYSDNATYVLTRNSDDLDKYTLKITGSGAVGRCMILGGDFVHYGTSLYHKNTDTGKNWKATLWSDYAEDITEIIVGEGINSWQLNLYVGPGTSKKPGHTLADGSTIRGYDSLTKITLPSTLKSIYGPSFSNCPALSELTIPANVTTISGVWFGTYANETDHISFGIDSYAIARDSFTVKGYPATAAEAYAIKCPPGEFTGINTTFESIQKENEVLVLLDLLPQDTSFQENFMEFRRTSNACDHILVREYGDVYGRFPDLNDDNYMFYNSDYNFDGWYLDPESTDQKITSTDAVSSGHTVRIALNECGTTDESTLYADVIKLYGHWGGENSNTTTTVYLDPRGGTLPDGSSTSVTFSEGDTGKWNLPTPVKEGYTFKYWYYSNDGEVIINNEDTIGQIYFPEFNETV